MKRRAIIGGVLTALLSASSPAIAQFASGGTINQVTDGSTLVQGPYKLQFTGATVSSPGSGVALVTLSGGGTGCTPAGGSATNLVLYGAGGACAPALDANVTNGTLTLGLANSVIGSVVLEGSSSGAATITGGTTGIFTSASPWALSGVVTLTGVSNALGTPLTLVLTNATGLPLTTGVTGTLPVANGGTGLTSGTSGGILAYTASGTLASSGALTANLPVIGGGAGAAPTVGTRSGNTTAFVTTTGTLTSGDCVKIDASGNFIANGSSCGGAGSLTVTDGTHSVTSTTTLTVPIGQLLVGGSAGSATITPVITDTLHATSATTANIGGQDDYNGSSITATLAALASGQSLLVTNQNASALTLALGGQTVVGLPLSTTLRTGGFYGFTYNSGGTLSGFGFPGFGTITSGALMKFAGADGGATAGDLSGDCSTSGALVVTCVKGSSSVFGIVKVDGSTITASGGVISAVGGVATSITPGTTTVVGATAPCSIRNSTSTTMVCTAETGTGSAVLATSPTLVTPILGTPTSGTLTNATGLPISTGVSGLGTGVATAAAANLSAAGGLSTTVASGTSALGTSAIASGACATVVTTSATNTATTDVIWWGFNGDPTGVTGYAPTVNGMLTIIAYPSANNVNYKACNNTSASVTPGAITLNWRVIR